MNELNIRMQKTVGTYCKKHQLIISSEKYGRFYYQAFLNNSEEIICNVMENRTCDRNLPDFYMKRKTNGKQKRIPRIEW